MQIYLRNTDKWEGKPLYEAIVKLLRAQGIRGATVLRAVAGYGSSGQYRVAKTFRLLKEVSLVVRVLERAELIEHVLPQLDSMMASGLITFTETDGFSDPRSGPAGR